MLLVLLHHRQYAASDDAVRSRKVGVDLLKGERDRLLQLLQLLRQRQIALCGLSRHSRDIRVEVQVSVLSSRQFRLRPSKRRGRVDAPSQPLCRKQFRRRPSSSSQSAAFVTTVHRSSGFSSSPDRRVSLLPRSWAPRLAMLADGGTLDFGVWGMWASQWLQQPCCRVYLNPAASRPFLDSTHISQYNLCLERKLCCCIKLSFPLKVYTKISPSLFEMG